MTNRSESTRSRAQDAGAGQIRGRCAKKGAANCALPGVGFRQRVRGGDSGPSPLSAVGGTGLPQLLASRQPARLQPVTNSVLSDDRRHPQAGPFPPLASSPSAASSVLWASPTPDLG